MFRVLVGHFARRLARAGGEDEGEVDMSLGALLALLASPGVFLALGLLDKYSSLLRYFRGLKIVDDPYPRAVGDGYMLLVFSMAVTGLVTLWKWDRILPDAADRLNLGPLPGGARSVFLASLAAIGMVAGVFIVDVNAGSMLIFPMVVTADQASIGPFFRLAGAHVVVLAAGSVFMFCSCFSLMGVLIAVVPGAWFGGISTVARAVAGLGILGMWMTKARWEWSPPVWFAAMYGPLIGRGELGASVLWERGLWGLGIAMAVALGGYAIGYRRGMEGALARRAERRRWPEWLLGQGGTAMERAAFRFSLLTLWRSEVHRLLVIGLAGAGVMVGAMRGTGEQLPFFAGYSLVVALRMAFGVPAAAGANWPFRLLVVAREGEARRVGRRLLWLHLGALVVLPSLVLCPLAVTGMVVLTHAVLIEGLLLDFRQIPFTVRGAGFRNTRLVYALLAVIGFALVPWVGETTAGWIEARPWRAVAPMVVAAVVMRYREKAAEAMEDGQPALVFEDREEEVIRLRL